MEASIITADFISGLLASSLAMAIPLLLAGLGEVFLERSGVLNMGLEGMILFGCFICFMAAHYSGSTYVGLLMAVLFGLLAGLFMGLLTLKMLTHQSITGIVFNFFALGVTGFFNRYILGATLFPPRIDILPTIRIPLLADIPIVGFIFQQNFVAYFALLLVPIAAFVLFRTNFGLKIRAVGGNAQAADTMGIDAIRMRYLMWMLCGVMASLAGAYLTATIGIFSDGMSSYRGFIVIALVVFARWKPALILFGALLFGFADALQLRLQALGAGALGIVIPFQFLIMLPYVLTIIVLIVAAKFRYVNPSVVGRPYIRAGKELM